MDSKEIRRIFYRDGYRLAHAYLDQGLNAENLKAGIARLYQSVDELLDSFMERTASDGVPAACKKGCSWCCYQGVFAVTHEFLYLQDYAQQHLSAKLRQEVLDRAREKSGHTLNKPVEEQLRVRMVCPFLEKGSCMAYSARPMACRIYLSSSLSSCKRDYDRPTKGKNIPELFEFPLLAGRMLNEGFVAYLKQSGIRSAELPLEQGYSSMATLGKTMEGWIERGAST